jgi:hypothetical protein
MVFKIMIQIDSGYPLIYEVYFLENVHTSAILHALFHNIKDKKAHGIVSRQ